MGALTHINSGILLVSCVYALFLQCVCFIFYSSIPIRGLSTVLKTPCVLHKHLLNYIKMNSIL